MSDSQKRPWSSNPNAPKIPYDLYFREKANFAGLFIGPILYGAHEAPPTGMPIHAHPTRSSILGIVIVLFFRCMAALLNPVNRRGEGIKWGLISHTMVTFSVATTLTGMQLGILSICYINNRQFPGVEGVIPPGPLGYQWVIYSEALGIAANLMFFLNNWLADGLLVSSSFDAAFTRPGI